MTRLCPRGHDKDLVGRLADGRCRPCRLKSNSERAAKWRMLYPNAAAEKSARWRAKNTEKNRTYQREWARSHRYNEKYLRKLVSSRKNHLTSSIKADEKALEVLLNGLAQST